MILIAESKTMASAETDVSREELAECRPQFDGIANAIMDSLRERTPEQLAAEAGITLRLAASLRRMIYEFPNKSTGLRAIEAFTGVVFRQLRLAGYDAAAFGFGKDVSESELISLFSRCLPELEGKKAAFFGDRKTAEAKKEFTDSLLRIGKAAKCVMLPVAGTDDEINALGGHWYIKKRYVRISQIPYRLSFRPSQAMLTSWRLRRQMRFRSTSDLIIYAT